MADPISSDDFLAQTRGQASASPDDFLKEVRSQQAPENLSDNIQPVDDMSQIYPDEAKGNYSGVLADGYFSQHPFGRILKAIGQSASDEWGAMKGVNSSDVYKSMSSHDSANDKLIVKSANEGWIRPLVGKIFAQEIAHGINIVTAAARPIFAGAAGIAGGIEQAGEELPRPLGEPLEEAAGALPAMEGIIPHVPEAARSPVEQLTEARAKGVIGPEGERGFFGIAKLTPEEIQARQEARKQAGIPEEYGYLSGEEKGQVLDKNDQIAQKAPEPMIPSVDDLARQVDPDTFNKLDSLLELQERYRASRQYTEGQLEDLPEGHPDAVGKAQFIEGLRGKLQDIDEKLRDIIPDQARARETVRGLLDSDTLEAGHFHDFVQSQAFENAIQIQDLQSAASDAHRRAYSLLDEEPTQSTSVDQETPQAAPKAGKDTVQETPQKATESAVGEVSGNPNPQVRPQGVSEGPQRVSGSSKQIETDGIANGILNKGLENLPSFTGINMKEQAFRAARFISNNLDETRKIIRGEAPVPSDIHPQMLFEGFREYVNQTLDPELVREAAYSPLNTERSLAAQSLRAGQGGDEFDLSRLLKNVEDGKRGDMRQTAKVAASIKASVEQSIAKFKGDLESFARSIECD